MIKNRKGGIETASIDDTSQKRNGMLRERMRLNKSGPDHIGGQSHGVPPGLGILVQPSCPSKRAQDAGHLASWKLAMVRNFAYRSLSRAVGEQIQDT